jgi:hypothetical protein
MLKGLAIPRLSHIRKSIHENANFTGWMQTMDEEHMSCWLQCLSASRDLELALDPQTLDQLKDFMDLPQTFGGAGTRSLAINFCRRGIYGLLRRDRLCAYFLM